MNHYRPEIDGLRALAVTLVVLFHLSLSSFGSGGYIGVDVFFVISGYLISGHLRKDLANGLRGIAEFYRRRVIRIFPALFATYLACCVAELVFKFAVQLAGFQHALLSSIFFGSNFYLWETKGYFDFRERANPLIHTWSLSIEEQFYIVLPLLLYLFRNRPARVQIAWLAGLTLASLIAAQWFVSVDARTSFCLVPLRAWELLAGSLLSYASIDRARWPRWLTELAAIGGVAMILTSAAGLNAQSPFPGFAALPAVVGSMLVLAATDGNAPLVRSALALPPIRFVGKISYSLYLWHWPVIVYARYVTPIGTPGEKLGLIAVAVAAATISWWLVEQPFRTRGKSLSAPLVLTAGGVAMLAMAGFALALPVWHRALRTSDPRAEAMIAANTDPSRYFRSGRCFLESEQLARGFAPECLHLDAARPNVLVLGDSHAAMLWWGLSQRFENVHFLQATASSCEPLNHYDTASCAALMNQLLDRYLPAHKVAAVVVSAYWQPRDAARLPPVIARLRRSTPRVVVFGPNPSFLLPFPEVAAQALVSGRADTIKRFEADDAADNDRALARATMAAGARYVSLRSILCPRDCRMFASDGLPILYDYDHLSPSGSILVASALPHDLFSAGAPVATPRDRPVR